jgi:hypothetical protein
METTKFTFNELGLKNKSAKELIIKAINNQINNYKIEYLSQWEREHSTTAESKDKKIEALENKKREVIKYFNEYDSTNSHLNLSLSIEVKEMITIAEHGSVALI